MQYDLRIALSLPRVIDVDVDVADITHARMDERIGRRANVRVGYPFSEVVPAIPAHGRRGSDVHFSRTRDSTQEGSTSND
jgi:hypothetical protein